MLEPLAAFLSTTLGPGCLYASTTRAAARAMTVSARQLPSDFFTPHQRRGRRPAKSGRGGRRREEIRHLSNINKRTHVASRFSWELRCSMPMFTERPFRSTGLINLTIPSNIIYHHQTFNAPVAQRRRVSNAVASLPNRGDNNEESSIRRFRHLLKTSSRDLDMNFALDTYEQVLKEKGFFVEIDERLAFVEKIVAKAEESCYSESVWADGLAELSQRLQANVLEPLASRTSDSAPRNYRRRCLLARALALGGRVDEAVSTVHSLGKVAEQHVDLAALLHVCESMVKACRRHHGAGRALEFLVGEWFTVKDCLIRGWTTWLDPDTYQSGRSLRNTAFAILGNVQNPVDFLECLQSQEDWRKGATLMIEIYAHHDLQDDAFRILDEALRRQLRIVDVVRLSLVRSLARTDSFEEANALYTEMLLPLKDSWRYLLRTGLFLFSRQGNVPRTEEIYEEVTRRGIVSRGDMAMMLQAHAIRGDKEKVLELWDVFFPDPSSERTAKFLPNIVHYSIVIFVHALRRDIEGLNDWLQRMSAAGFVPDLYIYNMILKSFAMSGDYDAIAALLDQMNARGLKPNIVSYAIIISLLARRAEVAAAESFYARAIQEGIVPDRRLVTSLMDAHVEAGSWKGVIRIFDYIRSMPSRDIRLTIEVYNTLLKAYVMIGAPFPVVAETFFRISDTGIRPDSYTYALLVTSACDAGRMDAAKDILEEMERLLPSWSTWYPVRAYVYTTIMAAHLRRRDKRRAKAIYDKMASEGITPTVRTFTHILRAYSRDRNEGNMDAAEQFLQKLSSEEGSITWSQHGRKAHLRRLYRPLMDTYGSQGKSEEVERLVEKLAEDGGETSLGALAVLLDVYRRSEDIEAVQRIWSQIWEDALRFSRLDALFPGSRDSVRDVATHRQLTLLCIPLSIYVDALSRAGLHLQIAAVWNDLSSNGFVFDSHNWNHLAVALVRAGEPERAFEVLEKVIIPYQQHSQVKSFSEERPKGSPLSFLSDADHSEDQDDGDELVEPSSIEHGKTHEENPAVSSMDSPPDPRRAGPLSRITTVRSTYHRTRSALRFDEQDPSDFAHPLHILENISPAWSVWRPHVATLRLLARVLAHLEDGHLVQPVAQDEDALQTPVREEDDDSEEWRRRARLAGDVMVRIMENYPMAVAAVRRREMRDRRHHYHG